MYTDESTTSESGKDIGHYLSLLRRRREFIGGIAIGGMILVLLISWILPTQYASTATIIIEDPEIPPEMIGSTVTSFAEKRLENINQRIMTTRNLSRIIKEFNLYPQLQNGQPILVAIEQLRDDFKLEKVTARLIDPHTGRHMSALISFNLTYMNTSPETAQKVTKELARLYLAYNYSDRRDQAVEVAQFLSSESERLAQRVDELEDRLTSFKQKHPSFVVGQAQVLIDMIDRTEAQIRQVSESISTLSDRKLVLQRELDIAQNSTDDVRGQMTLPQMRAELARISQIYGPEHPDIQLLKRRIAAANSDRLASADPTQIIPDQVTADGAFGINPAATRVQAQLETIDLETSRLEEQKEMLEAKLKDLEAKAVASPQLEQQYLELRRDYESAKTQYDETKRKQLVADQARVLEKSKKSERFTLLEPPLVPRYPAGPPRWLIAGGGFGAFLIIGLAIVFIMDLMDDRIYSPRQLQSVTGTEPLMLIPRLGRGGRSGRLGEAWSTVKAQLQRFFGRVRRPRMAS